jgi:hypothetical protein
MPTHLWEPQYILSTKLALGDPLLSLGAVSVMYVAIGADSMGQMKMLPVCTRDCCKFVWRGFSIARVATVRSP